MATIKHSHMAAAKPESVKLSIKSIQKPLYLRFQTRNQRNSNGYIYVFGVQLPIRTSGNTVQPNQGWKSPGRWLLNSKIMLYLRSQTRYQRNPIVLDFSTSGWVAKYSHKFQWTDRFPKFGWSRRIFFNIMSRSGNTCIWSLQAANSNFSHFRFERMNSHKLQRIAVPPKHRFNFNAAAHLFCGAGGRSNYFTSGIPPQIEGSGKNQMSSMCVGVSLPSWFCTCLCYRIFATDIQHSRVSIFLLPMSAIANAGIKGWLFRTVDLITVDSTLLEKRRPRCETLYHMILWMLLCKFFQAQTKR